MKYMMMMHTAGGPYRISEWSEEDIKAHHRFMHELNAELTEAGELVDAQGLAGPDLAKLVRAGDDGRPITDGVFPESKEFLAGFWIVDVEGEERALDVAAKASAAPGPGGEPLNLSIEVREVMAGPPDDLQ